MQISLIGQMFYFFGQQPKCLHIRRRNENLSDKKTSSPESLMSYNIDSGEDVIYVCGWDLQTLCI